MNNIKVEVEKSTVSVGSRQLKATWTAETLTDLRATMMIHVDGKIIGTYHLERYDLSDNNEN